MRKAIRSTRVRGFEPLLGLGLLFAPRSPTEFHRDPAAAQGLAALPHAAPRESPNDRKNVAGSPRGRPRSHPVFSFGAHLQVDGRVEPGPSRSASLRVVPAGPRRGATPSGINRQLRPLVPRTRNRTRNRTRDRFLTSARTSTSTIRLRRTILAGFLFNLENSVSTADDAD